MWKHLGRFLTGPDMGTFEEDFAPLREHNAAPSAISSMVGDVPFEEVLTGYGVAVAAETGAVAAVFHVYDRKHLDRIPRRYTVEAGKQLTGAWDAMAADADRYPAHET